jgi:putative hemolysin
VQRCHIDACRTSGLKMEINILLLILLIFSSAFFSGLEIAMFSLGEGTVRSLVEQKRRGAEIVEKLKRNPERLLVVILIGNNVANIGSASIATALAIELFGNYGVGLATGVMTLLILVFGEITPKTFSVRYNEKIALFNARPLLYFSYLVLPVAWLLEKFSRGLTAAASKKAADPVETERVVKSITKLALEKGKIEEHEHQLVVNAFNLDETAAERIMTPRNKMSALHSSMTVSEAAEFISERPFTRYPIFADEKQGITGVVTIRDIYENFYKGNGTLLIDSIASKPLFVACTMPVSELLFLFQSSRMHMAIVLDEYGETDGIVTLEDAIEELVGEIEDEADLTGHNFIKMGNGSYLVYASITIDDFNRAFESNLPYEGSNTLNGLLVTRFQDIPSPQENIIIEDCKFKIRQADKRRVHLVEYTPIKIESDQPQKK